MEVITKNAKETFELGREIGSNLKSNVFALTGDLGSGKTTFLQGFAKGVGIRNKIVSPTFILMRTYGNFYHLDLYRLEGDVEKEVKKLGLFDLMKNPKNIIAIEWAEKIKNVLPENTVWIRFESLDDDKRKIIIS